MNQEYYKSLLVRVAEILGSENFQFYPLNSDIGPFCDLSDLDATLWLTGNNRFSLRPNKRSLIQNFKKDFSLEEAASIGEDLRCFLKLIKN